MKPSKITGKRILLVEDESGARESMKLLFRIDRHEVVETTNGQEALERFEEQPFDLVVMDYAMPGMQGEELARRIKQIHPTQPILMVTAYVEKIVISNTVVDAIIGKPFSFDEIREAIARVLDRG
jgi:CheY-like chemotaxis protein